MIRYQNEAFLLWNRANVFLNLKSAPEKITLNWLDGNNYKGREFLINSAIENNLELKEQKLLIEKFKSELAYSKIEQMPDVNVSITHANNSSASNINKNSTGVGVSIVAPLFNRNQEKISSSEAKIKAQEFELDFKTNQLISLISNDINEFEISLKIAKEFPFSNIEKSLSNLAEANNDFKKGVLDFITYIELDSQEYQIIDAVIDTQINLVNSYSNLMIKIGNFTIPHYE